MTETGAGTGAGRRTVKVVAPYRLPLVLLDLSPRLEDLAARAGMIARFWQVEARIAVTVPLMVSPVSCGFPSPADDYIYAARAAEKMRRQDLASAHIIVFIETNTFKPNEPQHCASHGYRLPVATADTGRLIAAAMAVLRRLWRPGFRYKKAGVMLLDLVPASSVGGGLFDRPDDARSHARMQAIDALNGRFGRGTVTFGSTGRERQAWGMRREFHSPRYTTQWAELLRI